MRILASVLVTALTTSVPTGAKTFAELFPEVSYADADAQSLVAGLSYQQGEIKLAEAKATLNVPEYFYFLGAADARRVLVEAWGNPPQSVQGVLGMLLPADLTPVDSGAWGATISYLDAGYVVGDGISSLNAPSMLANLKEATRVGAVGRSRAGEDRVELIGWASPPYYDRSRHTLHWAKELKFSGREGRGISILNYEARMLGRLGVIEISIVADISELDAVKISVPDVLALVRFDPGARYEAYDASTDKVFAYGLDGLIAGAAPTKIGPLADNRLRPMLSGLVAAAVLCGLLGATWRRRRRLTETPAETPPSA